MVLLRDVHVETLFSDRPEPSETRCRANLTFEPHALSLERVTLSFEIANLALHLQAANSSCYDARRHQDETNEHQRDETPRAYSTFCHARSFALRARGLRSTSSSEAVIARRVSVVPSGRPRHVQTGCFGGQMHAA